MNQFEDEQLLLEDLHAHEELMWIDDDMWAEIEAAQSG
jgi:hypothetical protein